jgi:hypothetical protein
LKYIENVNLKQEGNNSNTLLGAVFIPTSNRVPKDEYRLIAIDIYGRYVMEYQKNKNTIIYCTEEQFRTGYENCT